MQAKKRYLLLLLCVSALLCVCCFVVVVPHASAYDRTVLPPYATSPDEEDLCTSRRRERERLRTNPNARMCRMDSCFDFSRCREFKVYVYPSEPTSNASPAFQRILSAIRESSYFTADPNEACVLVPSVDTLDRDPLSFDFEKDVRLSESPLWNGGRNHVLFNLFSGTWPDYTEDLGFDSGLAIVAKSSVPERWLRPGFDISLPLFPRSHPKRGGVRAVNGGPLEKGYLLVFKGKRYVYGIGSETRNALHHLNNGRDVLLLTTCRHGKQWKERKDARCEVDNKMYDRYEYGSLMENSTFCLVPRGRRLGSFRFLEALQAGCVPVVLANGWELPFSEVIDWSRAALRADERLLLQVPDVLRSLSRRHVHQLKQQSQLLWETYFSSVDKIALTVIEILRERVQTWQAQHSIVWNSFPGALTMLPSFADTLRPYPFHRHRPLLEPTSEPWGSSLQSGLRKKFTAVIYAALPTLQPLQRLLKNVLHSQFLARVLVVWGSELPPPIPSKLITPGASGVPVHVVVPLQKTISARFAPHPLIETDAVLSLDDDVTLTTEELDFAFQVWRSFPERIVGYPARSHYWDDAKAAWGYSSKWTNDYSIVLTGAAFYHRYYHHLYSEWISPALRQTVDTAHNCEDILLNFLVSHVTKLPPIKVTQRKQYRDGAPSPWNDPDHFVQRQACINAFAAHFGYVPLVRSSVRLDPVLFRDPVSNLRKRYRRIERVVGPR
ncbi:exostosin-1-like [Ornithodoros turicata]|uniref:exostosin-1-like n=1 Tax=Ornithodoros turicata TaxID=34597 RepID=UPI003139997C